MKEIVDYIVKFLLTENNGHLATKVSYGYDENSAIIIQKSSFFDEDVYMTQESIPTLPLKEVENIPILFGEPIIEHNENNIIINADLIASTYFLISRYEECVRRDIRDEHGRFIGKESLLYKADMLGRPIVEEYGKLLRKYLREMGFEVIEPKEEFEHIYLTHDVDQIWTWNNYYIAFRTFTKRLLTNKKNKTTPLKSVYNYRKYDPMYTFPELIELDGELKKIFANKCTDIYFMMGCTNESLYDRNYCCNFKRTKSLIEYLKQNKATIGIHTSYAASKDMKLLKGELELLEQLGVPKILKVRNHYLASREPEDFREYINNEILDDFTMGFADVIGFRLGTCRAVRWIDPVNIELTNLILHPMTVMECTLSSINYMNIENIEIAFEKVKNLIDTIKQFNGEVVLLWHNPSISKMNDGYQREMYMRVLNYLKLLR